MPRHTDRITGTMIESQAGTSLGRALARQSHKLHTTIAHVSHHCECEPLRYRDDCERFHIENVNDFTTFLIHIDKNVTDDDMRTIVNDFT